MRFLFCTFATYILLTLLPYWASAQSPVRRWAVGPVGTLQREVRTAYLYGGSTERRSVVTNRGAGLRAQYQVHPRFSIATGLTAIERTYQMQRPYDFCQLLGNGPCVQPLVHLRQYAYRTIEVPLTLNGYFLNTRRLSLYAGLSWVNAWRLRATYDGPPIYHVRDTRYFSSALYGLLGAGVHPTHWLSLNAEYILRARNRQVGDPILENERWITSAWDVQGLNVALLVHF